MPALLMRMSSLYSSFSIRSAKLRTDEKVKRSKWCTVTFLLPVATTISSRAASPRSMLRQARMTLALREAKSRAVQYPIPRKHETVVQKKTSKIIHTCVHSKCSTIPRKTKTSQINTQYCFLFQME